MVGMSLLARTCIPFLLRDMLTLRSRDIVDVKHIKTAVAGMIIGPLTRANDDIQAT